MIFTQKDNIGLQLRAKKFTEEVLKGDEMARTTKGKITKNDDTDAYVGPIKGEAPFYQCDLELVRVSKYTARYRVVNPEGARTDFNHIEFDRGELPMGNDFKHDYKKFMKLKMWIERA